MFEPWPAPAPVALEDEPYEKSRVSGAYSYTGILILVTYRQMSGVNDADAQYDAAGPAGSYPMQEQPYDHYNTGYDQYGNPIVRGQGGYDQAGYYAQDLGHGGAGAGGHYPPGTYMDGEYPPGQYYAPGQGAGAGVNGAGVGAAAAAAGMAGAGVGAMAAQGHGAEQQQQAGSNAGAGALAAQMGLQDGMMVRVKVGFVRTLEDELGELASATRDSPRHN
jgi:hypothetical protein